MSSKLKSELAAAGDRIKEFRDKSDEWTAEERKQFDEVCARYDEIEKQLRDAQGEKRQVDTSDGLVFRNGDSARDHYRAADGASDITLTDIFRYLGGKNPDSQEKKRALAEGTDASGGFTVPTDVFGSVLDLARAKSVVAQAGVPTQVVSAPSTVFPKIVTDPTVSWRAENAAIAESQPVFGSTTATPESCAFMFKTSNELLETGNGIENAIANVIAGAIAAETDRAMLYGSGTSNEPLGLVNHGSVPTTTITGALTDYSSILGAMAAIEGANYSPSNNVIMSPRTKYDLATLEDTTGQPLMRPAALANMNILATSNVPNNLDPAAGGSNIICGQWDLMSVVMLGSIRFFRLSELYMASNQSAFGAILRMDCMVQREAAFHVIDEITS